MSSISREYCCASHARAQFRPGGIVPGADASFRTADCRRKIYGPGHDQAILSLGINADLRSVFNWNVKQLFAFVTAEYETEANVLNQARSGRTSTPRHSLRRSSRSSDSQRQITPSQVVIWDAVISDKEQAWIRSDFVVNKYSLTDQGYGLRDNNVTLVMNWNTVPATGLLTLSHAFDQVHRFQVPSTYS